MAGDVPPGTSLISSYVRIKPLGGDKPGGGESRHRLTGWDRSGAVSVSGRVFDHAAAVLPPDATQLEAYETVARPLVRRWLAGHDVDLLCYGQTGAGKTFTMFGPPFSMARAAEALGGGDRLQLVELGPEAQVHHAGQESGGVLDFAR